MATIESAADDFYKEAQSAVDIDRRVVRDLFYYDALRAAIQDELAKDIPAEELQVNARHILFAFDPNLPPGQAPPPTEEQRAETRARAEAAMQALEDGEPFAELAKAVSNDTGSASRGGELGWASPDTYVEAFKDAVLNIEPGEITLVETEFGFHIIQVHAREIRPLSELELNNRRQQTFQTWLNEKKAEARIERREDWLERIPEDPTYNSLLGDILPVQ